VRFCGACTGIQRRARLGDGVAGLQHVTDDERDREAVADVAAAAERERDRQPGVVDAVEQPPQAVAHPDHAAVAPLGQVDDPLEPVDRVVVVAHQHRPALARPRALRAADHESRRAVQRQQPRGQGVAAGEVDQPLVHRHQLGHVVGQRALAGREVRALGAAVLQVPRAVRRPHRLEPRAPLLARLRLLQRLELELLGAGDRRHGRRPPRVRRQQPQLVPERLPDRLPVAVDRRDRLRGQPERLDPLGQLAKVGLVVGH
jgi:hypothetical protein